MSFDHRVVKLVEKLIAAADDAPALRILADLAPSAPYSSLKVRALVGLNRMGEAEAELADALGRFGGGKPSLLKAQRELRRAKAQGRDVQALVAAARTAISNLDTRPHPRSYLSGVSPLICPRNDRQTVVVNFGVGLLPIPAEDRLLASAGFSVVHAQAWLDDQLSRSGTSILGRPSPVVDHLVSITGGLGSRVITCGWSRRGTEAIFFAARAHFAGCLAFAPMTTFDSYLLRQLEDRRGGVATLRRIIERTGGLLPDVDICKEAAEAKLRLILVFGTNKLDKRHAMRFDGMDHVDMMQLGGVGHHCALPTIADLTILGMMANLAV